MTQPEEDHVYHHFSLVFEPSQVASKFSNVRFLLIAGCPFRAENQAKYLAQNLQPNGVSQCELLTKPKSRFVLYKVDETLIANHGMGSASMSIALHELFKMCQRAKVLRLITLIRFGTCGGLGVDVGTICITNRTMDTLFQDFVELKICQKLVRRPCAMDLQSAKLIEQLANQMSSGQDFQVRVGATVASNDFYEEQGRTNGAICDHSEMDKMKFLRTAAELGVINVEMESNFLAAMCHKLDVKFGVVCVSLCNRLEGDKVSLSHDEVDQLERRLFNLNLLLVKNGRQ